VVLLPSLGRPGRGRPLRPGRLRRRSDRPARGRGPSGRARLRQPGGTVPRRRPPRPGGLAHLPRLRGEVPGGPRGPSRPPPRI